jgi:hypothetical protein
MPLRDYVELVDLEGMVEQAVLAGHSLVIDNVDTVRTDHGALATAALTTLTRLMRQRIATCYVPTSSTTTTFSLADIKAIRALPWVKSFTIVDGVAEILTHPISARSGADLGNFRILLSNDGLLVYAKKRSQVNDAIMRVKPSDGKLVFFGDLGIQIMRCFGARNHLPALRMIYKYLVAKGTPTDAQA